MAAMLESYNEAKGATAMCETGYAMEQRIFAARRARQLRARRARFRLCIALLIAGRRGMGRRGAAR